MTACKYCGSTENIIRQRNDVKHGYEEVCRHCGRWIKWAGLPKNIGKRPPYPSPRELGITTCQFCRTPELELKELEGLETHHIDGDNKNNNRENLIVYCTSCHTLCHHQIRYRFEHKTIRRSAHV